MSLSGLYTTAFKDLYTEAEDETFRGFKIGCTINYPPIKEACATCVAAGVGNKPGNFFFD